jgi:hypothetical protein
MMTKVSDPDELAICSVCVESRRSAEGRIVEESQAGAQHIGRMRGTRDDPPAPVDLIKALLFKKKGLRGRLVRVQAKADYAIGKIKGKPKGGRVHVEIVDPRDSGWPVGYSANFLPEDLKPHEERDERKAGS